MNETQKTVGNWMVATFPGADPESPRKALRALEEMVELCLAAGASYEDIRNAANRNRKDHRGINDFDRCPEPAKVPAEAADVLIVLYGLAHLRGFDLHAEVDKKMMINRHKREWVANGDGTGYHIKSAATDPGPGEETPQ